MRSLLNLLKHVVCAVRPLLTTPSGFGQPDKLAATRPTAGDLSKVVLVVISYVDVITRWLDEFTFCETYCEGVFLGESPAIVVMHELQECKACASFNARTARV